MYRVYSNEAVPFYRSIRVGQEHGWQNDYTAQYWSAAFFYRRSQEYEALRLEDELDVGDAASERAHGYQTSGASELTSLESRAFGDDSFPVIQEDGRVIPEGCSFRMRINPDNDGALLRTRVDAFEGPTEAAVRIDGTPAGTWYRSVTTHGTKVFRFHEQDFRIPAALTRGRSEIRIEILPRPTAGRWIEFRHWLYRYKRN